MSVSLVGASEAGAGNPVLPGMVSGPRRRSRVVWSFLRNRKALVGSAVLALFCLVAAVPGLVAPYSPTAESFARGAPPSLTHLLGTTAYGQDVFSQLVWGTRESVVIAFTVGGLATLLSIAIGVSAGYLGGIADGVLSLFTDVILVIPAFPLIVVIAAYTRGASLFMLVVVLVATGWSYGARQLRAQMLSLRRREFLEAARVRGERRLYIMVFEVLPSMTSLIVASFLGSAVYGVIAAAGLQFVGLGNPEALSWGTMLYWAQNNEALNVGMVPWAIMPGVCVALLGGSLALMNYGFDELTNPALRVTGLAKRQRRGFRRGR